MGSCWVMMVSSLQSSRAYFCPMQKTIKNSPGGVQPYALWQDTSVPSRANTAVTLAAHREPEADVGVRIHQAHEVGRAGRAVVQERAAVLHVHALHAPHRRSV